MRQTFTRRAAAGFAMLSTLTLTTWASGCGGDPGLGRVSGRITYKGEPVPGGTVFFSPEEAGKRGAQGPIDSDGNYTLGTFDTGDGAPAGRHRVSVVAQGPDKPIPAKMKGKMMEEDMQGTGDPLVPRKYFSAESSGLTAEVVGGQSNTFDFELTD